MALTDREILGLKPKPKQYYAIDHQRERGKGALWLLIRPSGRKEFYFVYTRQKKRVSISLGTYNKSNAGKGITLSLAREKKEELATFLILGKDPKTESLRQKFEAEQDERLKNHLGTVAQLFKGYTDKLKHDGKKSHAQVQDSLEKNAFPLLNKETPANAVTSNDIKLILHAIIQRKALVQSNRVRSYLSAAFTYGLEHDNDPTTMDSLITFQLDRNPVRDVPKALKYEKAGTRELSANEIRQLWHHFNDTGRFSHIEYVLKLILATGGQRVTEVSEATWEEFDLATAVWELPSSRTKNGKAHLVPLNNLALSLLDEIHAYSDGSPYLFPHRIEQQQHIKMASLSKATKRFAENPVNNFKHFSPRDLRRTCKTRMGELGISKETRDRINNHALGDVSSKHYDRYDYLKEKRIALEAWGQRLAQIIQNDHLHNVVAINSQ